MIVRYVSYECGVRQVSPDSISRVYLGAIANRLSLVVHTSNFRAAIKSERVKFVLRGFTRIYNSENPKSLRSKTPFTLSMVNQAMAYLRSKPGFNVWRRERMRVALRVGIYFLLRRSEFLGDPESRQPGLVRSSVVFFSEIGRPLPYQDIGIFPQAMTVHLNVRFSKTDQQGFGRILQHRRQMSGSCIVRDLESWVSLTRDVYHVAENEGLFHLPGSRPLSSLAMASVMKETALQLGLDESKMSAHSLRYGGATILAAAGLPQYILAYYGGWVETSESLRLYSGPGLDTVDLVSAHMSRTEGGGTKDATLRDYVRQVQRKNAQERSK